MNILIITQKRDSKKINYIFTVGVLPLYYCYVYNSSDVEYISC